MRQVQILTYYMDTFEQLFMLYFCHFTPLEIEQFLVNEISSQYTPSFISSLYQRIISFKNFGKWWSQPSDNHSTRISVASQLVAIMKVVISRRTRHDRVGTYQHISFTCRIFKRLENLEMDVADGKITEQEYIDECNRSMRSKKAHDVFVENISNCNPIGSLNHMDGHIADVFDVELSF